ncbi:MAG TPA: trypsin-like peptidase domain-containing protein [Pyrinomonadaceae bacterium]|nr:trypsin-like peptidase domain-containing protein [Pyrinomonadaceae bacterium]
MPQDTLTTSPVNQRYRTLLAARDTPAGDLESTGGGGAAVDLSDQAIDERVNATKGQLYDIIKTHLGDKADLYEIANKIVADGGEALRVLRGEDDEGLTARGDVIDSLEAIIRTDGSRPSFMICDGVVDLTTSPVGTWADDIKLSMDLLRDAFNCVGRIDVPDADFGFQGTGFLIHENLIITNRHVLQVITDWQSDGSWTMKPGVAIDFGHEFKGRASLNRRLIKRVVYAGPDPIRSFIDHKKLDLALFELEPADLATLPQTVLSIEGSTGWAKPPQQMYIVGYPGSPGPGVAPPNLLELLFQSTFGCKRLAPGVLMTPEANVHTWTLAHDATTLGGNSGSVLLLVDREKIAAGLHYGGRWSDPRENWGHILGLVLDQPDKSGKTLRQCLNDFDVQPIGNVN